MHVLFLRASITRQLHPLLHHDLGGSKGTFLEDGKGFLMDHYLAQIVSISSTIGIMADHGGQVPYEQHARPDAPVFAEVSALLYLRRIVLLEWAHEPTSVRSYGDSIAAENALVLVAQFIRTARPDANHLQEYRFHYKYERYCRWNE